MASVEVQGVEGMQALLGQEIGPSEWRTVTQDDIDTFAELSGDDQWIHVDVERAKTESPFGTTIAHGNLTLSLVDGFRKDLISSTGFALGVNYGWNKIRFPAPVPVDARVRARAEVVSVDEKGGGWWQVVTRFTLEVEGNEKPCFVGDSVTRHGRADWRPARRKDAGSAGALHPSDRGADMRRLTVSVPSMPASRWPGTVQKKVYLPGLRSTVAESVPSAISSVSPTSSPLESSIATSWVSAWGLLKSIVTLPALAVALVVRVGEVAARVGFEFDASSAAAAAAFSLAAAGCGPAGGFAAAVVVGGRVVAAAAAGDEGERGEGEDE